jgi:hypothetical protein
MVACLGSMAARGLADMDSMDSCTLNKHKPSLSTIKVSGFSYCIPSKQL